MKKLILFSSLLVMTSQSFSQTNKQATTSKELVRTITLQMPRTVSDENPGSRGAAVAWHPVQKKYYAAMAGNSLYPMAVFDINGKKLSSDTSNCNADIRGLWFNPKTQSLEGNTYGDPERQPFGLIRYKVDGKGIIRSVSSFQSDMIQPHVNSVGNLFPMKQQVLFFLDGYVYHYDLNKGSKLDSTSLELGRKSADGRIVDFDEWGNLISVYNNTTVVYTGIRGAEWGILNYVERRVELYDEKTHFMTRMYKVPDATPTEGSFNFSFCNNQFWFFDMDTRTWTGYRM